LATSVSPQHSFPPSGQLLSTHLLALDSLFVIVDQLERRARSHSSITPKGAFITGYAPDTFFTSSATNGSFVSSAAFLVVRCGAVWCGVVFH
jgi:hypothetical protein